MISQINSAVVKHAWCIEIKVIERVQRPNNNGGAIRSNRPIPMTTVKTWQLHGLVGVPAVPIFLAFLVPPRANLHLTVFTLVFTSCNEWPTSIDQSLQLVDTRNWYTKFKQTIHGSTASTGPSWYPRHTRADRLHRFVVKISPSGIVPRSQRHLWSETDCWLETAFSGDSHYLGCTTEIQHGPSPQEVVLPFWMCHILGSLLWNLGWNW